MNGFRRPSPDPHPDDPMSEERPAISLLDGEFSVCRLERMPDADVLQEPFFIAGTSDEISLVCRGPSIPDDAQYVSPGWSMLRIEGPLDFSMVGVISGISSVLADAGISIFVVSTYLTDYFMVRSGDLERTCGSLASEGYAVRRDPE